MSESIDWDMLQEQYFSNKMYCEKLSKACKIVDDPFACNLGKSLTGMDIIFCGKLLKTITCILDYHIQCEMDLVDQLKSSYVTPYELVNVIKINGENRNCQEVSYKSTPLKKRFLSRIDDIKNFPPFIPSKKVIAMKKRGV